MAQFTLRELLSQQTWNIEVFSDVIDCGPHPESMGVRNEGFRFYVVCEHKVTGHRWEHQTSFCWIPACHACYWSCQAEDGESTAAYCSRCGRGEPSRAAAEARANILKARIEYAISLDTFRGPDGNRNWRRTEPAYGSQAYQEIRYRSNEPEYERTTYGFSAPDAQRG